MYQQKICYIDLYKNGLKCGNMGHVRLDWNQEQYRFGVSLCRLDRHTLISVSIKRKEAEQGDRLYDIPIIHGRGSYQSEWIPVWGDEKELIFEASGGIYGICELPVMGEVSAATCEIKQAEDHEDKAVTEAIGHKRDMLDEIRREHGALSHVKLLDNKWEQLCSMYEKVHPIGDDIEFVKIRPEDFVILRQEYQGLVRNSFLLHGYYNYHYILLGKYPDKYYIGVPGIMHEQERMAAAMFGFIGFERAAKELSGEQDNFGYYMMEVAI